MITLTDNNITFKILYIAYFIVYYITIFFSEYGSAQVVAVSRSNHDDYGHHQSEEAGLYSVSQRVPNVSTSYSNLCQQEGNYSSLTEWDRTTSTTTDAKDSTTSDALSDKQTSGETF